MKILKALDRDKVVLVLVILGLGVAVAWQYSQVADLQEEVRRDLQRVEELTVQVEETLGIVYQISPEETAAEITKAWGQNLPPLSGLDSWDFYPKLQRR